MSFVTDTQPRAEAGDRSFITTPKKKLQDSDIPGYQQEVGEDGTPTGNYSDGESTYTRTEILKLLASTQGMQNLDEEGLEELLKKLKEKKPAPPQYEGKVERIGV